MRYIYFVFVLILSLVGSHGAVKAQDDIGFIEVTVDNTTPYIGQQIIYTLKYFNPGGTNEQQIELPDFTGFGQQAQQPNPPTIELINEQQYTVFTQNIWLTPNQIGTTIINTSKIQLADTPFREGVVLETEPISINVLPLPEGEPENFTGAIGQFDMQVALGSESILLGEPATLLITIISTSGLETLLSPSPPTE